MDENILYIDAFNGISGDILLSAFIDAGFKLDILIDELKKIEIIDEFKLFSEKVTSFGITGTRLKIEENPLKNRNFKDIKNLIDYSGLKEKIKNLSLKILENLAFAEAKVHSLNIDNVHFHEIGAIDTIIDVVGVATAINFFNIDEFYCSTIPVGKGEIITSHGIYPNPAPATTELLKDFKVKFLDLNEEITTPTGAAIIKTIGCKQDEKFEIIAEKVGYGFGNLEFNDRPNFSRIFLGKKVEKSYYNSKVIEINFNVDDMTGEEIGYFIKNAMSKDILDISVIPTITKKNRPGYLITILVNEITDELLKFIFENTTTSGIRFTEKKRFILDRYFDGNKKIFKSEKLKIKKWKLEFDEIDGGGQNDR